MSKLWRTAVGVLKTTANTPSRRLVHTIQAVPRELSGGRIASRERAHGRIPAVIFSQSYVVSSPPYQPTSVVASSSVSRKLLITTERKQIKDMIKQTKLPFVCSTRYPISIRAGPGSDTILQSGKVLPIKIHMDEEGTILNLVFVWADEGTLLKVDVPIVYKGEDVCPGLKKGGSLSKVRPTLKYLCPAEHVPSRIEVDISALDIEDRISIHDVVVHPSMELLSKNDRMPVCKIQGDVPRNVWRMRNKGMVTS